MHFQPSNLFALALALEASVVAHTVTNLEAMQCAVVAHAKAVIAGEPRDPAAHPPSAMVTLHLSHTGKEIKRGSRGSCKLITPHAHRCRRRESWISRSATVVRTAPALIATPTNCRRFKSGPLKGHPSRICVVETHAGETGYVRRELLSFRPKIGVWCEVGKAMSSSFCYRFADGAISYIDRDF